MMKPTKKPLQDLSLIEKVEKMTDSELMEAVTEEVIANLPLESRDYILLSELLARLQQIFMENDDGPQEDTDGTREQASD
jgi:hypothetical protein